MIRTTCIDSGTQVLSGLNKDRMKARCGNCGKLVRVSVGPAPNRIPRFRHHSATKREL